jgi:hypothetical protein
MPRRSFHAILLFAAACASLTTACGSGGGDAFSQPSASVLGSGSRIRDIQGAAEWLDPNDTDSLSCSVPADTTVKVTGVSVIAIDRFDEVADGALGNLYVQDTTKEPGEYEGMTVFDPSFTPPDLRVAAGDVLDFFGVYTEFLGPSSGYFGKCRTLPEVGGAGSFRFEGSDVPAKKVTLADILGYENARRYLGMLITIEGVTIASDPASSDETLASGGRFTADIDRTGLDTTGLDPADFPKLSNELYDLKVEGPVLANGSQFKSVTGVLTYFYGFKLAPRSPADFELNSVQP